MKKSSEVCKMVGITRKTLRGYDEIGLLHPTCKTKNGYWLYDDEAIKTLFSIQVFVEAGYERKQIKEILESEDIDIVAIYKQVIDSLKEKRKRIDAMIIMMSTGMKSAESLSLKALKAIANVNTMYLYSDKSFLDYMEESISTIANIPEESKKEHELTALTGTLLIVLGRLKDKEPDSEMVLEIVQQCISEFANTVTKMLSMQREENNDDDEDEDDCDDYDDIDGGDEDDFNGENGDDDNEPTEGPTDAEYAALLILGVEDMLSDNRAKNMVEQEAGPGSIEFILKAITAFGKKQCRPGEDFETVLARMKEGEEDG